MRSEWFYPKRAAFCSLLLSTLELGILSLRPFGLGALNL